MVSKSTNIEKEITCFDVHRFVFFFVKYVVPSVSHRAINNTRQCVLVNKRAIFLACLINVQWVLDRQTYYDEEKLFNKHTFHLR